MLFSIVAGYFDYIDQTTSRLEMTKLFGQLLQQATPEEAALICYLSLGQLAPPYVGTQFNIAQKNMLKVLAQLRVIHIDEIKAELHELGDLGLVAQKGGWDAQADMSLMQVYDALREIERMHGSGSTEEKNEALKHLLAKVNPLSSKFIVRIVLGKLRLGFSDMTLLDALSWMYQGDKGYRTQIEYAYNKCADIGLIAATLKEQGPEGLRQLHVRVGIPIRPAAAERLPTAQAVIEKLGPCVAQPKLDGFRLQIHMKKADDKADVWFFSRNLQDMSYMFPDLDQAVKQLPVKQLIAEGEAIVYDPHTKAFLPFQETVKRKRKHGIEQAAQELPLQVFLFDLLYLNGQSLIDFGHEERRKQLLKLVQAAQDDTIKIIDERIVSTPEQLLAYFQENITAGLEGLVVKRPHSVYTPGKRNYNWIKLKRQEEGHLEDTIDAVVLGYYYGQGKRASFGIGAFLVGVYNKRQDRFETIAKVGTGLKDEDWVELKKKCDALASPDAPKNVVCAKELTPDVWVYPEIVCMIRADEITLSPLHTANKTDIRLGFALRFPRFMGYRPDKAAKDATDIEEINNLYEIQSSR